MKYRPKTNAARIQKGGAVLMDAARDIGTFRMGEGTLFAAEPAPVPVDWQQECRNLQSEVGICRMHIAALEAELTKSREDLARLTTENTNLRTYQHTS